jgi:hypothetical protein
VGDVQDLKLVMVQTDEEQRLWNELMLREHPLGDGPLVGRQLRYLIGSPPPANGATHDGSKSGVVFAGW